MRLRFDLVVFDASGSPMAVVEIKNREGLTRDIAVQLRRNMIVHGALFTVPYFLLMSQDAGFLWVETDQKDPMSPPSLEFDMSEIVQKYLQSAKPLARLRDIQLEMIVFAWFSELAHVREEPEVEAEFKLDSKNLLRAIKGGSVELEATI